MAIIVLPNRASGVRPPAFFGINPASLQARDLRVWVPLLNSRANHRGVFGTITGGWTGSPRAIPGAGWGYDFDGTNDSLAFPNVLGSALGIPITCSAWVIPDNTTHSGYIVTTYSSSQIYGAPLYARGATLDGSFAGARHYTSGVARRSSAGSVLATGVPMLLTATMPASLTYTDIKLYVNGIEVAYSDAQSADGVGNEVALSGVHSIGGPSLEFNGAITDARVYSRILSPNEVYALYDPASRWDLYWVPSRRAYLDLGAAVTAVTASASEQTGTDTIQSSNW